MAYVRVMNGEVCATDNLLMMASSAVIKPVEIGIFAPDLRTTQRLSAGEVGYIATGLKTVHECRVGDTVTQAARPAARASCRDIARRNRWFLPASTRWKAKIMPT